MRKFSRFVFSALTYILCTALPANARLSTQVTGLLDGYWELTVKATRYSQSGLVLARATTTDFVAITDSSAGSPADLAMTTFWALKNTEYQFGFLPLSGTRHGTEFFLRSQFDNGTLRGRLKAKNGLAMSFTATGVNQNPLMGIVDVRIKAKRWTG